MLKKDFLVRQMEEFGKVMAVILGFKKQQDWDKFEEEMQAASLKFTTLEIKEVEALDETEYSKQILNHPTLTQDQLKILADLLFERMNFYSVKNDEVNYINLRSKCISLYTHIQNNFSENEFDMNVHYKLEMLKKA
ncbi:MAG: hypothetical protein H0W73_10060 [Bacteroidetes bacterium]|nr:hypothetical protein [Bacteroidota bacterium]